MKSKKGKSGLFIKVLSTASICCFLSSNFIGIGYENNVYASTVTPIKAISTSSKSAAKSVKVTSVKLSKTSVTLTAGSKYTLTATVSPSNATNKGITWTTSNSKVATVKNGVITAAASGTVKITATTVDGKKTASCTVKVNPLVKVTSVKLSKATAALIVGNKTTLTATVSPSNATNKGITWTTSNAKVATVSNGAITAVAPGTAKITVTTVDGKKTAACTVTVSKKSTFSLGETVVINDSYEGKYELTVYKVEKVSERNEFTDINPAEVYKITYRYKLLAKGSSPLGLWVGGFDSSFDAKGKAGQEYPDSIVYNPQELRIVGTYCTAETFVAVMNSTDKLTLTKDFYSGSNTGYVNFELPTKQKNIITPPTIKTPGIALPSVTYGLGKKATISDKYSGKYEFTVNKVEAVSERNAFSNMKPTQVYKITYTYKLLGKGTSTYGLFIGGFDAAFDGSGEAGEDYPDSINYYPETLETTGTYCTAETFVAVKNPTDKLYLTLDYFDTNDIKFATFVIPTK